jgi:glycosyltransferase involved in cell wall biosynthesis
MRIGIDVRLTYYRQGGISWYAIRLLTALAKLDTENEYLLLQDRRHREPVVSASNFRRVGLLTPAHHRLEQWPLSLETRRLGLDLIHSPDFIPPLHNRIPAVITVHDLGFVLFPHFLTADAARYYGQTELAARRASRIIAVSRSTANDLVRLMGVPEAKITVIYEAADPIFSPLPREEAKAHLAAVGLHVPDEFILFVGTIEPRKNLHTLLQAYHRLRSDYRLELPLLLVGAPGWLYEDIMKRVNELRLRQHVHFLGTVANTALRSLYNLALLLAHPAYYEGFGLTVLEAMACGTPVICSKAGSLPEVAGDAALLIPPEDTEAWAAAMYRLLNDAELQADLRARGLRQAARFSWEKAAQETLAVYRQAVTVGS